MFNALVSKAPSVKITIEDDQLMVHPELVPGQPSQDPILRGTVLLELASARAVNKVRVVFEGLSDAFGQSWSWKAERHGMPGRGALSRVRPTGAPCRAVVGPAER